MSNPSTAVDLRAISFKFENWHYLSPNSLFKLRTNSTIPGCWESRNLSAVIIIFNFGGYFEYGGNGLGEIYINGVAFEGPEITQRAFAEFIPYSSLFLTIAIVLFAVSTMISWSYYGLQSWKFLFGRGKVADLTYKVLFLIFVVIGAAASMNSIWAFSDAMIFAMVFPNMIGLYFLFPIVKEQLKKYLKAINK